MPDSTTIVAVRVLTAITLNAAHAAGEWQSAEPIHFCTDWQGRNPDPSLETEVRVLWSPETLYLRFVCHFREIFIFDDSDPNGRRDQLWDRDVAEAFLQPPDAVPRAQPSLKFYKEFEVAPNGMWIDLDITPPGLADLRSGMTRLVHLDEKKKIWTGELAIPMRSLTSNFDPQQMWRANFYRVEGKIEPRKYMAWQPTSTPQPSFHVPEKFGFLRFAP